MAPPLHDGLARIGRPLVAILFLLTSLWAPVWAQEAPAAGGRTVTGRVLSADERAPLPGVAVFIRGTTTGAITDVEGNYSVSVPSDETVLVYSYVGYSRQELRVGNRARIDVQLAPEQRTLQEAVVVGYTSQERRDVAGSISSISGEELRNNSVSTFDAALQGRAPGLQVTQGAGTPGSAVRIRVRGQGAISGGGDPLVVIDGVPLPEQRDLSARTSDVNSVNTNALSVINPNDIESIEVLKDASAAAIYGARGANGVILITTKRGRAGKTTFDVGYYTGVSTPTRRLEFLNGPEWLQLYNEARVNDGLAPAAPNEEINISGIPITPNTAGNTNWLDDVFRAGQLHDFSVGSNGGNDRVRFYVGGNYRTEESFLKGGRFQRLSTRFNITNRANDRLEYGLQSSLNYTINQQIPTGFNPGGLGSAQSSALPIWPIRNPDGSFFGTQFQNTFFNSAARRDNQYLTNQLRTFFNLNLTYRIIDGLSYRGLIGFDLLNQLENNYFSPVNRYYDGRPLAAAEERRVGSTNFNTYHTLQFERNLSEDHFVSVLAGAEANLYEQKDIGWFPQGSAGFLDSALRTLTSTISFAPWAPAEARVGPTVGGYNAREFYRFISFFGQATYRFRERYLLNASVRNDGSSRFGPERRFATFPSVGLGWLVNQEEALQNVTWLSLLKLRASYGLFGSSDIAPFQWLGAYGPRGGYLGAAGYGPSVIPNPRLSWSQSQMADASIDFGLFNNRITGVASVFRRMSTNLLLTRPIQTSATGDFTNVFVNEDRLRVRDLGAEFTLTTRNLVGNLQWTTDFNITSIQNRVVDVAGIPPDGFGDSPGDARIVEGFPIGVPFLAEFVGVDPATGQELIRDIRTGQAVVATAENVPLNRIPVGNPLPKFFGGITNSVSAFGFDIQALLTFNFGSTVYDDGGKRQLGGFMNQWNQRREVLNRWQQPGDVTDVPRLTLNSSSGNWNNTTRFLYKNDFVRLRTLIVGYTIPARLSERAGIASARVFVGGQNLLTFTNFNGWDPEVTRYQFSRTDANVAFAAPYLPTPQARQVTLGVNITL